METSWWMKIEDGNEVIKDERVRCNDKKVVEEEERVRGNDERAVKEGDRRTISSS